MQFDMHNQVYPTVGLNIGTIGSSTTTNGTNIIDTQGYGSVEGVLMVGARTDGTYTLQVVHGDDPALGDGAAVSDAADLLGTTAATAISAANTVKRIGYVGNKRYVRFNVVSTSVSSGATVGVLVLRGRPTTAPAPSN